MCVASSNGIGGTFLGYSHRGWILWGTTHLTLGRSFWRDIIRWVDRVWGRAPLGAFSFFSRGIEVWIASLARICYIVIDASKWICRVLLTRWLNICVTLVQFWGCILRRSGWLPRRRLRWWRITRWVNPVSMLPLRLWGEICGVHICHQTYSLWVWVSVWITLLESLCISQRVQCMISWGGARVYASDHDNLGGMGVQERVTEDHGQLGSTERNVRAARVQCSNTLFQCQETLVNLSTFHSTLPIITLTVSCTLWARQIDYQKLSLNLTIGAISNFDLADGVRSGRSVVCRCASCGSRCVTVVDDLVHFGGARRYLFRETRDLDFVIPIFLDHQLFLTIKKVDDFTAINFEETHVEFHFGRR